MKWNLKSRKKRKRSNTQQYLIAKSDFCIVSVKFKFVVLEIFGIKHRKDDKKARISTAAADFLNEINLLGE